MKCPTCHSLEAKVAFTKGDLGDFRRKLVTYQGHDGNQARIEALTDAIVRLQERLAENEIDLEIHQAEEHPEQPVLPPVVAVDAPRSPRPKLAEDDKAALKEMLADGVPRAEIAEAFGVTLSTVQYYATQTGHDLRNTKSDEPAPSLGQLWQVPPWFERALCAQTDPEAFFPEKGGSTREAKSVCTRCTVAAECLDWALDHNERFGIWGGLSERERRKLSRHLDNTLQEPA